VGTGELDDELAPIKNAWNLTLMVDWFEVDLYTLVGYSRCVVLVLGGTVLFYVIQSAVTSNWVRSFLE